MIEHLGTSDAQVSEKNNTQIPGTACKPQSHVFRMILYLLAIRKCKEVNLLNK